VCRKCDFVAIFDQKNHKNIPRLTSAACGKTQEKTLHKGLINHVTDELIGYRRDHQMSSSFGLSEIQLRLQFIKYILTEGNIYLNLQPAVLIWEELILRSR